MNHTLPKDAKERKTYPLWSGLMMYFPDALAEVAHLSYVGNQQHNPGQPLHWAREKSTDQEDTLLRHLLDSSIEPIDTDGVRHSVKAAWRALAKAQLEIEASRRKDPDDKVIPPPEAPDYIHFIDGSVIPVPPDEDVRVFADKQRNMVKWINWKIDEGYTPTLTAQADGGTKVDLSRVSDGQAIPSFVVWGTLQKSSDSKRRALQPGRDDSSKQDTTFRNTLARHEQSYPGKCHSQD